MTGVLPEEGSSRPQVRGHTALFRSAPFPARLLAALTDAACGMIVGLLLLRLKASPFAPDPALLAAALAAVFITPLVFQALFAVTPGQFTWRLRRRTSDRRPVRLPFSWFRSSLYQIESASLDASMSAILLTLVLGSALAATSWDFLRLQPEWTGVPAHALKPYTPPASERDNWLDLPFFFASGSWPRRFEGQPVLFDLPYQAGPPKRLLGRIRMRWSMPEVTLTLEGPLTPARVTSPQALKHCMTRGILSGSFDCLRIQEAAVSRHLTEIRRITEAPPVLTWFEVDETWTTGFRIIASRGNRIQERYVLINPRGTQQTVILDRSNDARGNEASALLAKSIRSLELSTGLSVPRVESSQALQTLRPGELNTRRPPPSSVERLTEIQALLLSKASVEPASAEAFIGLARAAYLLSLEGRAKLVSEWGAVAKPLLRNSIRFATDVSPDDPRLPELEKLWNQVKNN